MPDDQEFKPDAIAPALARVAFKAPPFWHADPEVWFLQVEAQFAASDISVDQTKYSNVVAALDSSILACVKDVLIDPPKTNKYQTLKDRILKHFAQSESSKINALLKDCQLGEKRPSHLLSEMQNLAGSNCGKDMLLQLWLQRLPVNMQQVLSACDKDLESLAKVADKVHEVSGLSATVTEVAGTSEFSSLKKEIAELKKTVRDLSYNVNKHKRFRSRSQSGSRKQAHLATVCKSTDAVATHSPPGWRAEMLAAWNRTTGRDFRPDLVTIASSEDGDLRMEVGVGRSAASSRNAGLTLSMETVESLPSTSSVMVLSVLDLTL